MGNARHSKSLPHPTGVRLPFTLHQTTSTGSAPTNRAQSDANECGRVVIWNWAIGDQYYKQGKTPQFLTTLFGTFSFFFGVLGGRRYRTLSLSHWWKIHHLPTVSGHIVTQELTAKVGPLIVYNLHPEIAASHVWMRLDLQRPDSNRFYTIAEVEFYDSVETAGSARLRVKAITPGTAGNAIATTTTITGGTWASATLTGGYDKYDNLYDGSTISIGGVTYTFVSGALDATGKVKIGSSGGVTIVNLMQAINAGTGAGVLYATGTTANEFVSASAGSAEGTIGLTARSTLTASAANAIALSSTGITGGEASFTSHTLTGGQDGIYYSDPGFSFTSIVSAINQGSQGLEMQVSNETADLLMPDLRMGRWDKAVATIQLVNWVAPSGGTIVLFGGRIGRTTYDNTGFWIMEIDNQMSRKRPWPAESWSPTCRAQLGDERCKFDIESMARVFSISEVVSQTEIRTHDLGQPANYWQNGVIQILTGFNEGEAVELVASDSTAQATGGTNSSLVKANGWIELKVEKRNNPLFTLTAYPLPNKTYWNPNDGSRFIIGGKTYTFVRTLVTGDGIVKIQGKAGKGTTRDDQSLTLEHLRDAMLLVASGKGSTYSTGTTAHTTVKGGDVELERFEFSAKIPGSAGNALGIAYSGGTNMIRSNSTLKGGKGTPAATGTSGAATSGGFTTLHLVQAFPFPLAVGDRIKIWPGCQKRFVADCKTRFRNTVNFRGEPFAPTAEGLKVQ